MLCTTGLPRCAKADHCGINARGCFRATGRVHPTLKCWWTGMQKPRFQKRKVLHDRHPVRQFEDRAHCDGEPQILPKKMAQSKCSSTGEKRRTAPPKLRTDCLCSGSNRLFGFTVSIPCPAVYLKETVDHPRTDGQYSDEDKIHTAQHLAFDSVKRFKDSARLRIKGIAKGIDHCHHPDSPNLKVVSLVREHRKPTVRSNWFAR